MIYALDKEELAELRELELVPRFVGARMLTVVFRTDEDVVRRILPKPLQPAEEPLAVAFVADYPETNFGLRYREAGLALRCRLRGELGLYHLFMPVDDDTAMVGGRESFGFPKKMAERIDFEVGDGRVEGSVRRHGTELLRLRGALGQEAPTPVLDRFFEGTPEDRLTRSFLIKFFPSPTGKSLDYLPRVVRQETGVEVAVAPRLVEAEIELGATAADPLTDVPVRGIETAIYGAYNLTLNNGRVVRRIWNVLGFLPYLFFRTDTLALIRQANARQR